ncbi:hypothetical protein [Kribbella sp.]|uniref:hypothetical protein n=1 Tax=Kribbella sp. TaxID=1871183 RepID=UPI002D5275E2|nr:hypothetical protein [Kribbella sp.]HZX05219.1 hypothetical protein [Kribbella sp.]
MTILLILNTLAAIASTASAFAALARPGLMTRSTAPTTGERIYTVAYAARAVPFGIVTAIAPFVDRGVPTALVLFAAAAAQLVDIGIATRTRVTSMLAGATVGAIVHLITAIAVLQ